MMQSIGADPKATVMRPVPSTLKQLSEEVALLEEAIDKAGQRLVGVTRPGLMLPDRLEKVPQPAPQNGQIADNPSAMRMELQYVRDRIEHVRNRIQAIFEAAEI